MRLKLFFTFCLSLAIHTISANEPAIHAFQNANHAYDSSDYNKAVGIYEGLLQESIISTDLHFNLGNAYFKQNQVPKAILHYEKALKIDPNNEDAAYNLKLANEKTVDKIEGIPELFIYRWWKAIFNLFAADTWSKLTIAFIFLAALLSILYFFTNPLSIKKLGFYGATSLFFLAMATWFLAHQQKSYLERIDYAIIIEPTVNINSSPSEGSSKLFVLHEGTKVRIEDQTNDWLEISIPNGNKGWIKQDLLSGI